MDFYNFEEPDGSLLIIDVSNPAAPFEAARYDYPALYSVNSVYVYGNHAFLSTPSHFEIIDVSNPAAPFAKGFFEHGTQDAFVFGHYAYVARDLGLQIIDVSCPETPYGKGFHISSGSPEGACVSDGYAYVADEVLDLQIINVIEPQAPFVENSFEVEIGKVCDVHVSGGLAFLAVGLRCKKDPVFAGPVGLETIYPLVPSGLMVLDVSYPEYSIPEIGFQKTGIIDGPNGVFVSGDYAFVADGDSGLRIIEVGDVWRDIFEIGLHDTPGDALEVYVSGNFAYVADGYSGLRIIDVSDPAVPFEIGSYSTLEYANGIYVSGNFAYVTYKDSGFRIIDVKNPSAPFVAGFFSSTEPVGISVEGNHAFISDLSIGLRVIDVSTPSVPYEIGFYTPGYGPNQNGVSDVFVSGDYVYATENSSGFSTYSYFSYLFVDNDYVNNCDEKTSCYLSIQEAIDSANPISSMKIVQGDYDEPCQLKSQKTIRLKGGYDSTYSCQVAYSTIESLIIEDGTIIVENLIIGP